MKETRNPYQILNASETATEQEIKKLFKQCVAMHHPDKHRNDPNAARHMQDINWAWSELSTPEKRKATDERLRVARQQSTPKAPPPPRASPPPSGEPAAPPPTQRRSEVPWGAIIFGLGLTTLFGAAAMASSSRGPRGGVPPNGARWDASTGRYRGADGRFTSG